MHIYTLNHYHHHCLWPLLEHRAPTRALYVPDPGTASQVVPRYNKTSLFQPPGRSARCFLGSLSLWVPDQSLTCDTGHWLSEGVSTPSPTSLEFFIFCWLLLGPFLCSLLSLLRQVLMNLWIFFSGACVSPCFNSIQQHRLCYDVKHGDLDVDGQLRCH